MYVVFNCSVCDILLCSIKNQYSQSFIDLRPWTTSYDLREGGWEEVTLFVVRTAWVAAPQGAGSREGQYQLALCHWEMTSIQPTYFYNTMLAYRVNPHRIPEFQSTVLKNCIFFYKICGHNSVYCWLGIWSRWAFWLMESKNREDEKYTQVRYHLAITINSSTLENVGTMFTFLFLYRI